MYDWVRPHVIIALTRGGLVPARLLSDRLDVPKIVTIDISFYPTGQTNMAQASEIDQMIRSFELDWRGWEQQLWWKSPGYVLVCDDILDSGLTLGTVLRGLRLPDKCEVRSAVLFHKGGAALPPVQLYAGTTVPHDTWVIFPWEKTEFSTKAMSDYNTLTDGAIRNVLNTPNS